MKRVVAAGWLGAALFCAPTLLADERATLLADERDHAVAVGPAWCSTEVETLTPSMCFAASAIPSTELVIFLHGLVKAGEDWQHAQQRGMKAYASAYGFDVLMPKGRLGVGPQADMIAWPAKPSKRAEEDEVIEEILAARQELERRRGTPYGRVLVMGFSNGAYYGTSLALRGRLDVDGYAVFAGGSGRSWSKSDVASIRKPMFVAIASKDKTTIKNMKSLDKLLKALNWPHKTRFHAVGHEIGAVPMREALTYLRGQSGSAAQSPTSPARNKAVTRKQKTRRPR